MVKAFILADMAELSLNYDNGYYLDTLPVEFLHVKPDRVQQQLQELRQVTEQSVTNIQKIE